MWIREATLDDVGALAGIFYRAVRVGAAPFYSEAERFAWAAQHPSVDQWTKRLDGLLTLVAQDETGIAGFMSMRMSDGYLDLAFVEPDLRGTGVAVQIYAVLENRARAAGLTKLHSDASHMFKPVLQRLGWDVVRANAVTRTNQTIGNWIVQKQLS
jgi:putative acetyltransferase